MSEKRVEKKKATKDMKKKSGEEDSVNQSLQNDSKKNHKHKKTKLDDSGIGTSAERSINHKRKHSININEPADITVTKKKKKSKTEKYNEKDVLCENDKKDKKENANKEDKKKKKKSVTLGENDGSKILSDNNKTSPENKKKGKKRKADKEDKPAKKIKKDNGAVKEESLEVNKEEAAKSKKKTKKKRSELSEAAKKKMTEKKQEKRRSKLKQKREQKAKQQSGQSSGMARREALQYLRQWKNERDRWFFQKVRQIWLLKNMYEPDQVPETDFDILLEYLEGLQGHARVKTCEDAETLLAEDEAEESTPVQDDTQAEKKEGGQKVKKQTPEQLQRIRQILQNLA